MVLPDPQNLRDAARHAEDVADHGVDTNHAKALVEMRNALRKLETVARRARKEEIEPALDDLMEVGDNVAGLQRVNREERTVTDNAAALEMLENTEVDLDKVMKIYSKRFSDAVDENGMDPSEVIEIEEKTSYRPVK